MREDWIECEIGIVSEVKAGFGFPKNKQGKRNGKYPFYKVGDISRNVQAGNRYLSFCENYIDLEELKSIKGKFLPKNSIVFAKIGEALKLNRRAITKVECLVDNNAIGLKAKEDFLENLYLYFFLLTIKLEKYSRATTVPSVRKSDIEEILLPFPPLPEQRAIVAKIEQLFSELDNGIANLKTAQEQLKVYRQAVLKKAFDGELTNNSVQPMSIGSFSKIITKGASPKWQGYDYVNDRNELLFITSENIREGFISLEKEKYLPLGFNKIQKRSVLRKGDVLFNIVGASIGRSAIYNLDVIANINQAVAMIRLNGELSNQYLNHFLNSEVAKQEYLKKQVEVARANLSLKDVNEIMIPWCSLKEQHQIVQQIESRLSVCDKVEETITENLQKAEALRQSILKKAFAGELLTEAEISACKKENDWEPAGELLKRIEKD